MFFTCTKQHSVDNFVSSYQIHHSKCSRLQLFTISRFEDLDLDGDIATPVNVILLGQSRFLKYLYCMSNSPAMSSELEEIDVYELEKQGTFVEDKGFDRSLSVKENGKKNRFMCHPHAPLRRNWGTLAHHTHMIYCLVYYASQCGRTNPLNRDLKLKVGIPKTSSHIVPVPTSYNNVACIHVASY